MDNPERGPCHIRFNTDSDERASWAEHTGLVVLSDGELDAAYNRAHNFIREDKERLINEHGWTETDAQDSHLFSLSSPETSESPLRFSFPTTFSSFTDAPDSHTWKALFEHVFHAAQSPDVDCDLFITGPNPLSNMFYLLQSIAPGMLLLVKIHHLDDGDEEEYIRILPRESWVASHTDMLTAVLGRIDAYDHLLDASRDEERSFLREAAISGFDFDNFTEGSGPQAYTWHGLVQSGYNEDLDNGYFDDDDFRSNSDDWFADYTACGSDCGYCGHCDYP